MYAQNGVEDVYLVTSETGRSLASFADKGDLDYWLRERAGNGVRYRTFRRLVVTLELDPSPDQKASETG